MPETRHLRRDAFGLALIVVAFGMLGNSRWIEEPSGFDISIHDRVVRNRHEWPGLTALLRAATRFGNPGVATPTTLVVTVVLIILSRCEGARVKKSEAFVWLGTIVGGRALSNGLKLVYHRARPPLGGRLVDEITYSFPSTHSTFAAVFFTMLAILIVPTIPAARVGLRMIAAAACIAPAFIVGASRVWLGVHYPTDVLGGWLVGFGWVLAVCLVRRWLRRWSGRWETGHRAGMIPQQPGDRSRT